MSSADAWRCRVSVTQWCWMASCSRRAEQRRRTPGHQSSNDVMTALREQTLTQNAAVFLPYEAATSTSPPGGVNYTIRVRFDCDSTTVRRRCDHSTNDDTNVDLPAVLHCLRPNQASCSGAATICPAPCDLDLWPSDLESGVRVTFDVGYLCANFSLSRPLCSRLRPDVRDRQTDVRQHHCLMLPPMGGSIITGRRNYG